MGLLKKIGIIKSILIFLSLAFLVVIFKSNYIMFSGVTFLEQRTEGRLELLTKRNFIMNVVDGLNPLKGKIWNQRFDVAEINLSFSRDDLDHFEEVITNARQSSKYAFYMPNEINVPINSDIKIDGIEYKAEVKLHGTNNPHFVNPKKFTARTYERGVESETLSCGTGAVASVISLHFSKVIDFNEVHLETLGGVLTVSFDFLDGIYQNIWLKGKVELCYIGEFQC